MTPWLDQFRRDIIRSAVVDLYEFTGAEGTTASTWIYHEETLDETPAGSSFLAEPAGEGYIDSWPESGEPVAPWSVAPRLCSAPRIRSAGRRPRSTLPAVVVRRDFPRGEQQA